MERIDMDIIQTVLTNMVCGEQGEEEQVNLLRVGMQGGMGDFTGGMQKGKTGTQSVGMEADRMPQGEEGQVNLLRSRLCVALGGQEAHSSKAETAFAEQSRDCSEGALQPKDTQVDELNRRRLDIPAGIPPSSVAQLLPSVNMSATMPPPQGAMQAALPPPEGAIQADLPLPGMQGGMGDFRGGMQKGQMGTQGVGMEADRMPPLPQSMPESMPHTMTNAGEMAMQPPMQPATQPGMQPGIQQEMGMVGGMAMPVAKEEKPEKTRDVHKEMQETEAARTRSVAIVGQEVNGPQILDLLIGNDDPGSVVELTLEKASVGPCKRSLMYAILRITIYLIQTVLTNMVCGE